MRKNRHKGFLTTYEAELEQITRRAVRNAVIVGVTVQVVWICLWWFVLR